jgi:hypothetical protein
MTARKALAVEASENSVVSFEYDGDTYTVDKNKAKDLDVLEAFEEEKIIRPMKLILGEAQYRAFRAKHSSSDDLEALGEAMFKVLGVTPGE